MCICGRLTSFVLGCITGSRFQHSLEFESHIAQENGIVCLFLFCLSFSIYCQRQVYFVHSGLQDDSDCFFQRPEALTFPKRHLSSCICGFSVHDNAEYESCSPQVHLYLVIF